MNQADTYTMSREQKNDSGFGVFKLLDPTNNNANNEHMESALLAADAITKLMMSSLAENDGGWLNNADQMFVLWGVQHLIHQALDIRWHLNNNLCESEYHRKIHMSA
jgi:hypothetical protein